MQASKIRALFFSLALCFQLACENFVFACNPTINYLVHEVVGGNTLWSLATTNDATVAEIQYANYMAADDTTICPGDLLFIPTRAVHYVVEEDTLTSLSKRYGATIEEIKEENALVTDQIYLGQLLIIPVPFNPADWPDYPEYPRVELGTTTTPSTTTTSISTTSTTTTSTTITTIMTSTSTTTTTTIETTSTRYIIGENPQPYDVDGSGTSSISDVIILAHFVSENVPDTQRKLFYTDINEDGYVDALDLVDLLEFVAQPRANVVDHMLVSGDTLTNIAARYSTTIQSILPLNPWIKDPNKIPTGKIIRIDAIDVPTTTTPITTTMTTTTTATNKILEDFAAEQKSKYEGLQVGLGVVNLATGATYLHNEDALISGGCTVKLAFETFALIECERKGIDISTYTQEYRREHYNGGSGVIKYDSYGSVYTAEYLLNILLTESDNIAYNILLEAFGHTAFQEYLTLIGGQQLNFRKYGDATVKQRINEWLEAWDFINSDALYADVLKTNLENAKYCYLAQGMENSHAVMHKSGWCSGESYNSASDCAIIDNQYLVVILTDDYQIGVAHTDVVRQFGALVEEAIENGSF